MGLRVKAEKHDPNGIAPIEVFCRFAATACLSDY